MSNSQNFIAAGNSKKALKKLSRAMVLTLSISIAMPIMNAPSAQAVSPSLTNYYQLDSNGNDSVGGQNATLVGAGGYAPGRYRNGYSSAGGGSGYLDMGTQVGLFGARDFTMGFWFNALGGSGHFINKRIDNLHFITFQLLASGQIQLELRGNSQSTGNIYIAPASARGGLNDGVWHHMAVVRSGSTLYLYVDGQISATDTGMRDMDFNDPNYNNANFIFGGTNQYPVSFAGTLDDLKIYNGALSQTEVQASMLWSEASPPAPSPSPSPTPTPITSPSPSPTPTPITSPSPSPSSSTLAAPVITTLRAGTTSSLHVFFNSVPNATGYLVNVYQDIDGTPLMPGSVVRFNTTQGGPFNVEVTGLTPQSFQDPVTFQFGNTYQIRVVALGDGVNYLDSAESQSWQGRTLMEPLTKFQITSGTYTWPVFTPFYLNGSGGSVKGINTFSAANGTASGCAIREENIVSGGVTFAVHNLVSTSSGTCIVSGSRSADANYSASTSDPKTVTFTKIAQAPLIFNDGSGTFGTAIPLVATGGSGTGSIRYHVNNGSADNCALSASGNSLVSSSAGTCFVIAIRAEDNTYLRKLSSWATFTFAKRAQNVVTLADGSGTFGTAIPLVATGGSGTGSFSYLVTGGSADNCALSASGNSLVSSSAGTCFVIATKAEDNSYLSQSSSQATFTFAKRAQTAISLTSLRAKVSTALPLTFIGGSGTGAVTFETSSSNWWRNCVITNDLLTSRGMGDCTVLVTKAGDRNYLPVTSPYTTVSFVAKL